jgi:nucleotide-binding universal stress UspA family protein
MAMRILLALDESESSERALQKFTQQFRCEKTEVRVLHVLEPITVSVPPQMAPGYAPELFDLAKPAKDLLDRAAKFLGDAGFKTDTVLRKGDVREVILDTAQEWKADLIVLGSHSRIGAKRFLLGSVAESVARHAPCSVEIVRNSNGQ